MSILKPHTAKLKIDEQRKVNKIDEFNRKIKLG